jgi:predicted RNase H-like HicB family nuclease
MANTFTAVYQQDGDWITAYVEELPGANSQGRTLDEAQENLREAVELILLCNRESAEKDVAGAKFVRELITIDA